MQLLAEILCRLYLRHMATSVRLIKGSPKDEEIRSGYAEGGYKLYSFLDLLRLEDDPNRWIVPNFIPFHGRVVAYGHGGMMKTTLFGDLAVAVASGGRMLNTFPVHRHGPVLMISTEGNKYTMKDRFAAFVRSRNMHPRDVKIYYGDKKIELHKPAGVDLLDRILTAIKPIMVILDPYRAFFTGNENATEDACAFTDAIDQLLGRHETTFVVIHHSNAQGGIRGSTVLHDWGDAIFDFKVKKNQKLAGVPDPLSILEVTSPKMRDGQEGLMLSAVPFFDKELGITTFGIYDGMNSKHVAHVWLMLQTYKLLLSTGQALTKSELSAALKVGADRMGDALEHLVAGRFVTGDVSVWRSTSSDGTRGRHVSAYAAAVKTSLVDATEAIIRAIKNAVDPSDAIDYAGPH